MPNDRFVNKNWTVRSGRSSTKLDTNLSVLIQFFSVGLVPAHGDIKLNYWMTAVNPITSIYWHADNAAGFAKLIEDNVNSCNAVVRANACAVREIVMKEPCDIESSSWQFKLTAQHGACMNTESIIFASWLWACITFKFGFVFLAIAQCCSMLANFLSKPAYKCMNLGLNPEDEAKR